MTTYFVTRHKGALDWAASQGHGGAVLTAQFDPVVVRPGDVVLGTLPVHLAAEVCARGGRFLHLELDLAPADRGLELSAADMAARGARLVEYRVRRA